MQYAMPVIKTVSTGWKKANTGNKPDSVATRPLFGFGVFLCYEKKYKDVLVIRAKAEAALAEGTGRLFFSVVPAGFEIWCA